MSIKINKFKGAVALSTAAFFYASFGVLIREMAKMFGNNTQVAVRFAIASSIAFLITRTQSKDNKLIGTDLFKALSLGIVFGVIVLLFTYSVNNTTLANSTFVFFGGSILSSLLIGTLIFRESFNLSKLVAIVVALVGLSMYLQSFFALSLAVVAAFIAGLADGISNGIRKSLSEVNRILVLEYVYGIGALIAVGAILFSKEQMLREVSLIPVLATFLFAAMQIGLGTLLLYGFAHFDVNIGTVILSMELFFAALFGFLFFREIPAIRELIGGLLIFVASIISVIDPPLLLNKKFKR